MGFRTPSIPSRSGRKKTGVAVLAQIRPVISYVRGGIARMCQGAVASCPSSSFLAIYLCQLHLDTRPQLGLICLNQNSSPSRPESDPLLPHPREHQHQLEACSVGVTARNHPSVATSRTAQRIPPRLVQFLRHGLDTVAPESPLVQREPVAAIASPGAPPRFPPLSNPHPRYPGQEFRAFPQRKPYLTCSISVPLQISDFVSPRSDAHDTTNSVASAAITPSGS